VTSAAIIVTGSAGGIGVALCERFRRDGFTVVGIDRRESTAADIEYREDLARSDRLVEIGAEVASTLSVKAVVHNGATQPLGGAGAADFDAWAEAFRVNVVAVEGLVAGTRASLAANRGSVVAIGSVHARATSEGIAAYATTKAALEGWVRAAALDLGPEIRVNAIAPGAIDTPKLREGFARWGERARARLDFLRDRTALRRVGAPADVAGAAAFLVGDDASFITGTTLVVDGGATARLGSE